ncbi:MAG: Sec-independent protein translocase protein TatB [Gammaproteobacteria bacterium]|nr:Sec-independent protein translocase protein TatB [Gammaproteobacteria bacterium]
MSGIAGSELLLLCIIGLLILGPERLPRVARQIGSWVGKARQMTRAMQRQIEEELDAEKNLGIDPKDLDPRNLMTPREDDTYSPLHDEEDDETVPAPATEAEKQA